MNRLPEVKKFIFDDVPLFHNAEFKAKPGAPPVAYFLNAVDEAVETVDLSPMTRQECNDLFLKKGFYKKQSRDEVVPDEYLNGPYKAKEEL